MKAVPYLIAAWLAAQPMVALAWAEQQAMEFIMAHNPVLHSYRIATAEYTPVNDAMGRVLEHTSVYGKAGAGGTDFRDNPFIVQAGVQISIPLVSTREKRAFAAKAVEETRAIDEVRSKVMLDLAQLRQHEADLAATAKRLKFYEDKSQWLQQRVDEGNDDVEELWTIGQKLNEERAAADRLKILLSSQRYQVANHAGDQWQTLLAYLSGTGELR
jgi:hypothetical protein